MITDQIDNSEAVQVTFSWRGTEPQWLVNNAYEAAFVRRWLRQYVALHPTGEKEL